MCAAAECFIKNLWGVIVITIWEGSVITIGMGQLSGSVITIGRGPTGKGVH